jgi:phospholipid-translocating ATPase
MFIVDNFYLIVDGTNLMYILGNDEIARIFFRVALLCRSVICCRVSPKQKSQVVLLTKSMGPWICLSIGDGANDVPMIMEANIGRYSWLIFRYWNTREGRYTGCA